VNEPVVYDPVNELNEEVVTKLLVWLFWTNELVWEFVTKLLVWLFKTYELVALVKEVTWPWILLVNALNEEVVTNEDVLIDIYGDKASAIFI